MDGVEDLVARLADVEEQLRDRAYERLRAAADGDDQAARDEKALLKARRAVERAIRALQDADPGADG